MTAPQPKPPKPQYSFTSFQVNNPTAPPPGDKLDSEYAQTAKVISDVIDWVGTSLNSDGSLKTLPVPGPSLTDTGDTAQAGLYASLAGAWAEHMPDTIPPDVLAVMAVTGDHWSSRWWANRADQIVQNWASLLPPGPPDTARYIYLATSGQTLFAGSDRGGQVLAYDPANQQTVQVFKRGLLLIPTDDYADNVANRVTLNLPAVSGDIIQIFVNTLPPAWATPQTIVASQTFNPPTGANYTFLVTAGGVTLTFGPGRTIGQTVTVKDAIGVAGGSPITVQAAATIDNNPTYTLMSDFASLTLMWTGTLWGTV